MKTGAASWTERIASPGADPPELPGRAMTRFPVVYQVMYQLRNWIRNVFRS